MPMGPPLTTKAALLQTLRDGPGYARDLIRRVKAMAGLQLHPGRVYPALGSLREAGLVTARRVTPRGTRGARSRIYYELTSRGVEASSRQRRILADVVRRGVPATPDPAERSRMAARLLEVDELAELGQSLRQAMLDAGR